MTTNSGTGAAEIEAAYEQRANVLGAIQALTPTSHRFPLGLGS